MCFSRCSSGNSSSSSSSRTLSLEDCLRIGGLAARDFFCDVGDDLRTGGLGDKAMSGSVELRIRGRGAIPTDGDVKLRNMAGDPRVGAVTPRCSTGGEGTIYSSETFLRGNLLDGTDIFLFGRVGSGSVVSIPLNSVTKEVAS